MFRRFALAAAVVAALGVPVALAQPAAAAPIFTWSGADAALGNPNWSSGANWVGGVAPAAPGTINVVFPAGPGCSTTDCRRSTNDLTGLTLDSLTVTSRNVDLQGNGITVAGPVSITSSTFSSSLPITVTGASQIWTVDHSTVSIGATGPTNLTISIAGGSVVSAAKTGGSLVLAGADPAVAPSVNGTIQGIGGTSAHTLRNLAFRAVETTVAGSFTTDHAALNLEAVVPPFGPGLPSADLRVQGNATLDVDTTLALHPYSIRLFPVGFETRLSKLTVTGTLNLGSAAISLPTFCGGGSPFVIATSAPNGLSGTLSRPGPAHEPIPNGGLVASRTSECGPSPQQPGYYRINYDVAGGIVTATPVPAPTITLASSHTPHVTGSPVTFTATVSPAPTDGTVSFSDNGTPIPGCTARPVTGGGAATCTTTYATPGTHVVKASYSGGAAVPPVGPSTGFTQAIVPPPTATITSASGVTPLGTTIEGTASDVGGPGLLGVVLYYHSYTGGPSGAVLANCTSCGAGLTSSTWSFTPPPGSIPGIYSFVAQAFDVAGNAGPASNVIYQIIS